MTRLSPDTPSNLNHSVITFQKVSFTLGTLCSDLNWCTCKRNLKNDTIKNTKEYSKPGNKYLEHIKLTRQTGNVIQQKTLALIPCASTNVLDIELLLFFFFNPFNKHITTYDIVFSKLWETLCICKHKKSPRNSPSLVTSQCKFSRTQ